MSPCAISSSGTNSGRNVAGVIHGHFVFTGNKVTIMSPLAKPSRIRPLLSSIVRKPGLVLVATVASFDRSIGISITAGLPAAAAAAADDDDTVECLVGEPFRTVTSVSAAGFGLSAVPAALMCTLSVSRTAAATSVRTVGCRNRNLSNYKSI